MESAVLAVQRGTHVALERRSQVMVDLAAALALAFVTTMKPMQAAAVVIQAAAEELLALVRVAVAETTSLELPHM